MTTNETRKADSPSTSRNKDGAPPSGAFTARDMALSLVAVAVGWLLHYHLLG